jgi:3-methyl-2-oxobutanoate hydroxymethyltransferase
MEYKKATKLEAGDIRIPQTGNQKITVDDIIMKKATGNKITMITSYDYCMAKICDVANVDMILVGDSAATVMMGYETTRSITMEEMLIFCKAVKNGTRRALIVGDMPFGSYQSGSENAIANAIKFIQSGCDAVKIEGGIEIIHFVKRLSEIGIPVMGHIGLMPQTSSIKHGFRLRGSTAQEAMKLIREAKALEEAGAFSIVLEKVTCEVAKIISTNSEIPIIGIASGVLLDGQVLVLHDLLGLYTDFHPRFVKKYINLAEIITNAVTAYSSDVKSGSFPSEAHTFHMEKLQQEHLMKLLSGNGTA